MGPDSRNLDYAAKLIGRKARYLARKVEFADVDRDDIAHDLLKEVLERWPSFDPARAKATTFIARIVEHGIVSMIRGKRAAKRDVRKTVGLADERAAPAEEFDEQTARGRRGCAARDPFEEMALWLDVLAARSDLPTELQRLCALLTQYSMAEVSRLSGRPRTSLYNDLHRIRKRFEDAGLRDYL